MNFDEYQHQALKTAIITGDELKDRLHWVLGITGEAGEIAEKSKKILRDKNGVMDQSDKESFGKEIGDVLWYLAVFADHLGLNFENIASDNLEKLASRQKRGKLSGSGDNR